MTIDIVAEVFFQESRVAEVIYRSGLHVEVRVVEPFESSEIDFVLAHSENGRLKGKWEDALDNYFNEGRFDSKETLFPGEMRRVGSAREHKSLFMQAIRALSKDLEPHGYTVKVQYV